MKRKIVLGLALFTVLFLAAGAYVATSIRGATSDLRRLIELHEVEMLRERFLVQIRGVQSDLVLGNRRDARNAARVIANVGEMTKLIGTCFECHHAPQVTERLSALKRDTDAYERALHGVLALRLRSEAAVPEVERAFRLGEELIARVRNTIDEDLGGSVADGAAVPVAAGDAGPWRLGRNTRRALADIARAKVVLYTVVVVGPLLAALLAFIFISGLTRPLDALVESTRRLKRGDLEHRVSELDDEFGELAVSFNEMARSLKEQMQKMQRTEQMVVCGALAAGLAQEIRSPLAGIKIAVQVLADEGALSEKDRGVVHGVAREVVRVESLVTAFLDFARPAKPCFEPVNVNDVVERTLELHAMTHPPANRPGAIRVVKELGRVPDTMGDPIQLRQVLLNLVRNAVESMPDGGTLRIRTSLGEARQLHVEIADTGRGIDPDDADRLFQPFFTTKPNGTGLGLATSKQLLDLHRGAISVGANPGGGTVFSVHLPVLGAAETAA